MSRKLFLMVAIGVLLSACAVPLGRSLPECDSVKTSVVLEVQSVPGSSYVSCVNGLKTGWSYQHLEARSGHSEFRLDSDRLGDGFVRVENVLSCDVGSAVGSPVGDVPIQLFKDIVSETTVEIVVVPEGASEITWTYAADIRAALEDAEFNDRITAVTVSIANEPTAVRVRRAVAAGAHVITIGLRDAEEESLTYLLSGDPVEHRGTLDELIDEIEDVETQPSYRGKWYYVFDGGCVVYTFDAEGPGVDKIESDIALALGFYDANELRQVARDAGYNLP
jgi:hypothetical protein